MNWKKIVRSTMCLVVVLAILLNCVPVKADASAVIPSPTPVGNVAEISFERILPAIIWALGICTGASDADWNDIYDSCYRELLRQNIIDQYGKIKVFLMDGANFIYGVSQTIIECVRDLVFSFGSIKSETIVSPVGFHYVNIGLDNRYWDDGDFNYFLNDSDQVLSLIKAAYENDFAIVFCGDDAKLFGFFWKDGYFTSGLWENPDGVLHASDFGVYSLDSLNLLSSYGTADVSYPVYYSKQVAESQPDFLTSDCWAIDWDSNFLTSAWKNYDFPAYRKYSYNSTWDSVAGFSDSFYSNLMPDSVYSPASEDDVIWNSTASTVISTSKDLTLQNVAPKDEELAVGYPEWNSGAITVPGSNVGTDDEEITIYPIGFGSTVDDTLSMSQSDIWSGTISSTNTNTGTNSDSIANVGATTFWDTLSNTIASIFVPSQDYLSAKVDALTAEFGFIGPIVTAARSIVLPFNDFEPEPPVIYLHLEDTRGSYDLGGTVPFIDMTWYAEYKPIGDALLSSLLWVVFVWRLFRQLPGLIAGLPGDFVYDSLQGLHINLPSRSMDREVQKVKTRMEIAKNAKKGAGK